MSVGCLLLNTQSNRQMLIASMPTMQIFYTVSETTDNANLYLSSSSHGRKYKLYKRVSGGMTEYKSLVAETMHKGIGWESWQSWFYSNQIDLIAFSNMEFDESKFSEIELNGDICNKLCYNGVNLALIADEIEDINVKDFKYMLHCYMRDLREYLSSHDFIQKSLLHYKISTYLPSNGFKIINAKSLFLMYDDLGVDRFDILCQGITHTFVEEWECDDELKVCRYIYIYMDIDVDIG